MRIIKDLKLRYRFLQRFSQLGVCYIRDFGWKAAIFAAYPLRMTWEETNLQLNRQILKVVQKQYEEIIRDSFTTPVKETSFDPNTLPCWVFWWQGEENAPEIVQICLDSIRKHAGTHPVILLTQDNLFDYIQIPEHILQKLWEGKITLTHFSDIVRCRLLYSYGGIWADATIYCTGEIGNELRDYPFYSIKDGNFPASISHSKWDAFFLMAHPGLPLFRCMNELFDAYWRDYDYRACYLLVDVFLTAAYEQDAETQKMIDNIPFNNQGVRMLAKTINDPFDANRFEEILKMANLHKLSYKIPWNHGCGQKNTYDYLCEMKSLHQNSSGEKSLSG